jgi:hypothetical protein
MTDQMRGQVTRKQIEGYFLASGSDSPSRVPFEDRQKLVKNMDAEGWIPFSILMQMKSMVFPGHDTMRECIYHSSILEMAPDGQDKFRCKNKTILKEFNEAYTVEARTRVSTSKSSVMA